MKKSFQLILPLLFLLMVSQINAQGPGYAISFDGVNQKVTTTNAIIPAATDFTISAWIKRNTTGTVDYIAGNYGLGNPTGVELYVSGADLLKCFINGLSVTGVTTLTADIWYHVAVVYSAGTTTATIYLNGVQEATSALMVGPVGVAANFTIGNGPDYDTEAFAGLIDEVKVYNSAISSTALRNEMHLRLASASGTLAYWRFDDASGVTASEVNIAYNGTLVNGTTWVTSTAPFGTGSSSKITVAASSSGTASAQQYTAQNLSGSPVDFYITLLSSAPNTMTGVSTVNNYTHHWFVETYGVSYGAGARIFIVPNGGINPTDLTTPSNVKLFYRTGNSDGGWTNAGGASSVTQNSATYGGGFTSTQLLIGSDNSTFDGPPVYGAGSTSTLNFGSVVVGSSSSLSATIQNTGAGYFYGSNAFSSSYSGTAGVTVNPSSSNTFTVTFSPTSAAVTNGTVTITDNAAGSSHTINLTGSGILAAPALTLPTLGWTGVSVLPTFTWGPVTGASTYILYVSDNVSFLSGGGNWTYSLNVGSVLTYSTFAQLITDNLYSNGFPLTNGTTYYWKVAGVNASSVEGTASASRDFTTTQDITVNLSTPSDGSTVYSSPAYFGWYLGTPTSGLKYIVQYMYDSGTGAPTTENDWVGANQLLTTSLNKTGPVLYGKTYYWRVLVQRNTAPFDYVYYPAATVCNSFTTAGGSSVTVYPSWPIDATVYTNSPTLYWYLDQYATGLTYEINYSKNSVTDVNGALNNGETNVLTSSSNLYKTIGPLAPGTTYYWQVRAIYTAGSSYSLWTTPVSLTTNGVGTVVVPIPSYPIGGVTVYTTSPYLYWYLPTVATGLYYDVLVADDATDFSGGHIKFSGTTTIDKLYIQATGLTPGQTYFWVVKSHNSLGTLSGWSETPTVFNATFTVAGGTNASYPVATWPTGSPAPVVYTPRPALYWYLEGNNLGLTGYHVKYTNNHAAAGWSNAAWLGFAPGANSSTEGQATRTMNQTSWPLAVDLTYGATYYWAVAATSTGGESAYSTGSFTVVGGSNATTIELSTPSDGSTVYSKSPTLYWYVNGSSVGIVNYTVRVSQSNVFATYTDYPATITYKTLSGLQPGATYFWQVRANYAVGSPTAFSSPWSFTVNTGSQSVVQPLVGGPNNVTVNTASPTLSWVLPAPTAANSTYEVQLADNPNFTNAKTLSSSKSYISATGLNAGKGYFWKVRSKDGTGNTSYYSGTGQFKVNNGVTAVEDQEVIPTQFELSQNYPNPFNPTTKITYALPQNSFVSVKVYDMLGREVRSLVNNEMLAGNHSIEWSGEDNAGNKVASGAYIYRITAGNFISTKKMVMIK